MISVVKNDKCMFCVWLVHQIIVSVTTWTGPKLANNEKWKITSRPHALGKALTINCKSTLPGLSHVHRCIARLRAWIPFKSLLVMKCILTPSNFDKIHPSFNTNNYIGSRPDHFVYNLQSISTTPTIRGLFYTRLVITIEYRTRKCPNLCNLPDFTRSRNSNTALAKLKFSMNAVSTAATAGGDLLWLQLRRKKLRIFQKAKKKVNVSNRDSNQLPIDYKSRTLLPKAT